MPELAKAELRLLDATFKEVEPKTYLKVQFNPETLKVSFANQLQTPQGAGDQSDPAARLFVGAGTTKLSVQLWFDVTAPMPEGTPVETDVRKLTQKVAFYITPKQDPDDPKKFIPPAVRFSWGSFEFDGIMESLEESIELFSPEGKPLRASVTFTLSQQRITEFKFGGKDGPAGAGVPPGTRPLTPAPEGVSLQGMAAIKGRASMWQDIAAANGIENPRRLLPGQLVDMSLSLRRIR